MLITCSECGKQVSDKATSCPNCGNPIAVQTTQNGSTQNQDRRQDQFFERIERIERERHERELNKSDKSRLAFVMLGLFLGWLGIHNFYIGKAGKGIGQILMMIFGFVLAGIGIGFVLLIGLCIWILVDICSVTQDADGKPLS